MTEAKRLELYLTHRGQLVNYANGILGDAARAEDVVQEAFFRFVRRPSANEEADVSIRQPASYLYRIVRNIAFDLVRRRRVEERTDEEVEWWMMPSEVRTPEQEFIHNQTIERIEAVLAAMPLRSRLAVEMSRFGGYTLQEIGARLGISQSLAHRLVHEGLVEIAIAMDDEKE